MSACGLRSCSTAPCKELTFWRPGYSSRARKLRVLVTDSVWREKVAVLETDLAFALPQVAKGVRLPSGLTHEIYLAIQRLGNFLVRTFLKAEWAKGSSETVNGIQEEADEGKLKSGSYAVPDDEKLLKIASEIVALPYVFYIRTVLLQIRNLLFFVVAGYVLTVLAISSYPFQASRSLAWCMSNLSRGPGYSGCDHARPDVS